jgi:hypothetical protein
MTIQELINKLKKYNKDTEVCILDHRCLEAFPAELTEVRKATKKEANQSFFGDCVVLD